MEHHILMDKFDFCFAAFVLALILVLLLSGCAAIDRDGRSLICFGWCWQIEGENHIESIKLPRKEDK